MPYGIDKKLGGDSPSNVKFMESCVKSVTESNPDYSKSKAVAICKAQLRKKKAKAEMDLELDDNITREVNQKLFVYKQYLLSTKEASNDKEAEQIMERDIETGRIDRMIKL
jgi:anaerobic ribonucleoside-triphosphate reductase